MGSRAGLDATEKRNCLTPTVRPAVRGSTESKTLIIMSWIGIRLGGVWSCLIRYISINVLTYIPKSEAAGYSETPATVNLEGEKSVTLTRPWQSKISISESFAGDHKAGRFRIFRLCSGVTYNYQRVKYNLLREHIIHWVFLWASVFRSGVSEVFKREHKP